MAVSAVLSNRHVSDRLTPTMLAALDPAGDPELSDLLIAAPKMARALNPVLNLDLAEDARRLIAAEIREALR
ncbi:hypothetical protein [Arthrobacter bambusae]|uniref:hypothetical protein n=1 Tax=Arthrobacter bambusae TaxID=1338426 RepID=UPI0027806011|nr:hypothetical protein [Arthrobacter bambusae]MDQ0031700.1 hypothetical protein [Arthrobacter bambusae]MDQ0098759.1 hypothetical protein [Arthrobacter bambusae]